MSDATCEFELCERGVNSRGLCGTHYMQRRQGRELTPIRTYIKAVVDEKGRVCTECGEYKLNHEYYQRMVGKASKCKDCAIKKYGGN